MVTLKRNKRILYLCKKYVENNITKFKEPIKIKTNYQPISSAGEIISIGQEYSQYLRIEDVPKIVKQFSNGDRCYAYTQPPKKHDKMCQTADFYVYGEPITTLNNSVVRLKRLTGDDSNENY